MLAASGGNASLDRQTLAAFGAPGSNHGATAACFHARQKTVGPGAFDFGGLIGAFHNMSNYLLEMCA